MNPLFLFLLLVLLFPPSHTPYPASAPASLTPRGNPWRRKGLDFCGGGRILLELEKNDLHKGHAFEVLETLTCLAESYCERGFGGILRPWFAKLNNCKQNHNPNQAIPVELLSLIHI